MTTQVYDVKLLGIHSKLASEQLSSEEVIAQVVASFSQMFKLSEEKARKYLENAPFVIKRSLNETVAKRYQKAMAGIGIACDILPAAASIISADEQAQDGAAYTQQQTDSHGLETCDESLSANSDAITAADSIPPAIANGEGVYKHSGGPGFDFKIEGKPDFAFISVRIPANQTLKVEASAMATMDTNLKMKTKMKGGFSRMLTGESIFMNEFTAQEGVAEIGIAPAAPGDATHVYLSNENIYLQNSAFVAAGMDVAVESKWQGFTKGFFSGENLFLIRCSGTGDLWFNTYGAMIEKDIDGDYVVDTGNIVAFTEGLEYKITKVGGYKSLFFSGEGFVCRFSGKGKIWLQTRGVDAFSSWLQPFRAVKSKS